MSAWALVGDIGGTNCRLALVRTGDPHSIRSAATLKCADHSTFEAALDAYLQEHASEVRVEAAVLAVAGPVANGSVAMTNHPWTMTEAALSGRIGGRRVRLVNDYAALAYAAPALSAADLRPIGPACEVAADATLAVMGAGTGFGVSALVRDAGREAALVGEGGHAAFAPQDEVEVEVQRVLARRFGRVSIERILSGPGLLSLHEALSEAEGRPALYTSPDAVSAGAAAGEPQAAACTERFCAILGAVAGDLALAYGARGGVLIAGGVSQKLLATPAGAAFRPRFEDKGRFRGYVAAIPTFLLMHPHAALVGAARALETLPDPTAASGEGT